MPEWAFPAVTDALLCSPPPQVGTGATVATLADASELPTTVTVAQVNYSAVADGEVRSCLGSTGLLGGLAELPEMSQWSQQAASLQS